MHGVRPNGMGNLDCNGYSPIQRPVTRRLLLHRHPRPDGHGERFRDNGHYVGHDEPSIRFLSNRPGSGDNVTFTERLPRDPAAKPTVTHPGHDVTHWFELSIAPWFGMSICDPRSYPQRNCMPNSDSNAPHGAFPGGGAAFMEMQFYPPGFAPRVDAISCDNTHWCAALNIDSLEANAAGSMNNGCIEPVNFAFIQRNGVPAGPPSPQLSNLATVTPNSQTLLMNPGDLIRTRMFDASIGGGQHAFEIKISDLTTGQSGFMIASAANGFMNTSMFNCSGTPFNFQPLFNTARVQNSIGWSVLLSGILTQYEIGHFEPCSRVTGPVRQFASGVTDTAFQNCHGAYENAGPPDSTQRGQETSDAPCYRAGDTHDGLHAPPNMVTGCLDYFSGGDLDFDGTPYYADWPNSLKAGPFPSPFLQRQPTTCAGPGTRRSSSRPTPRRARSTVRAGHPAGLRGAAAATPPGTSTRTTRRPRSAGSACGSSAT